MSSYKRIEIPDSQYTMLHGGDKHEVELPHGDLDLWMEWYADKECVVWLYFDNGLTMPYANGMRGHFNVKTSNALSVVITCAKSATVVTCVKCKNLAVVEQADWTPVEIVPPRRAELQISALVSEQVRRELENMGVLTDDKLEIGEEDNLEDDYDDEGFGPGFMEEEEPASPRAARGKVKDSPVSDAAAVVGDGIVPVPDAEPVASPAKP